MQKELLTENSKIIECSKKEIDTLTAELAIVQKRLEEEEIHHEKFSEIQSELHAKQCERDELYTALEDKNKVELDLQHMISSLQEELRKASDKIHLQIKDTKESNDNLRIEL